MTYQSDSTVYVDTDADGLGGGGFGGQVSVTSTNVEKQDFLAAAPDRGINAAAGLAYDRTTNSVFQGRLYLVYTDESPNGSDDMDVYVRFSDNDGATWSVRRRVNDDVTTNSQFFPRIAVDQTTGAVGVGWYDARLDAGQNDGVDDTDSTANDEVNFFASVSTNGGGSFVANSKVTTKASKQAPAGGNDYGDYSGLDFFGGILRPAWADNANTTGDNPAGTLQTFDIYTAALRVVANGGMIINVTGDTDFINEDDQFLITLDPSGTFVQIFVNDSFMTSLPGFTAPIASVRQINVFGLGGNDTLTVDSTNGLITAFTGIRYDGGDGFDQLDLEQTAGVVNTTDTLGLGATVGSGRSIITSGVDHTQFIDFQNLEPIFDLVPAATYNITSVAGLASLLQAANEINYDFSPLGGDFGLITVDAFEPITFRSKTNLVIDAGAGRDNVVLDDGALPLGLETITVNGGSGDDIVTAWSIPSASTTTFVSVTFTGGAGDDQLEARVNQITPFILDGGPGRDVLTGGRAADKYLGGESDDTLVSSGGEDEFDGGGGFDTIVIKGTADDNVIEAFQNAPSVVATDNYTMLRLASGLASTILVDKQFPIAPNDPANHPTVEQVRIEAGDGNDRIEVGHADAYTDTVGVLEDTTNGNATQMLRFSVDGGAPNASDRLIVRDDGTGDLVLVREAADGHSGRVTVAPVINTRFGDVVYENIEKLDILPFDPITGGTGTGGGGRVVVFQQDPFEHNDNRLIASEFSDLATTNLNPTIDPGGSVPLPLPLAAPVPLLDGAAGIPGDEDWYVLQPTKTSTFRLTTRFDTIATVPSGRPGLPGEGNLDTAVYNSDGVSIATGVDVAGIGEQVTFSAQSGKFYFLRVKGAALANTFSLAINTYTVGLTDLDDIGPQITSVSIIGNPVYNLFSLKPNDAAQGPTPLVNGLSIGIRDLPPRDMSFFPYPALVGGVVTEIENNNTILDAQTVDPFFSLTFDPNIGDQTINTSNTVPHATITGTGDGTFDYFSFNVDTPGVTGIFDVDGALNGALRSTPRSSCSTPRETSWRPTTTPAPPLAREAAPRTANPIWSTHLPAPASTSSRSRDSIQPARRAESAAMHSRPARRTPCKSRFPITRSRSNPGLFQVRGDANGVVAIKEVKFVPDPIVVGQPATGTILLSFFRPLPDDRFTLTVFDSLSDAAGNKLDGESNAIQPLGIPTFPSGNGFSGGDFVARFTVDSRPEIGVYAGKTVVSDINGNGSHDPANADFTNRDLAFLFGETSDQRFAGKLSPTLLPGFDVLATYGRFNGTYRFLIDISGNGAFDGGESITSPAQISALAVAGNFDGNLANGDEVRAVRRQHFPYFGEQSARRGYHRHAGHPRLSRCR